MALHPSTLFRSPRAVAVMAGAAAVSVGIFVAVATGAPQPVTSTSTSSPSPSPTASPTPRRTPRPTPTPSPTPTPEPAAVCPYDGLPVADGVDLEATALGVQIENHPAARPARNLSNADMVVEATVEGDTTRFTGIFLCKPTEGMTGPVRSARYYSIDLWQDLHLLTVGFGASPGSNARFESAGMPYPNGINGGWPWYARHGSRAAPHNLYVDLEGMRDGLTGSASLAALAARVEAPRAPFAFDAGAPLPADGDAAGSVSIQTNSYWRFGWDWDGESESWLRSDAGAAVVDEVTGDRLAAKTVVVQIVTQETVYGDPDPGGNPRRLHHLVGSGTGTIFVDGRAFAARWSRPTASAGTTWTFANGEPVVLPPGQVWLEIVPTTASVTVR